MPAPFSSPYMTALQAAGYLGISVAALHSFLYRRRKAGFPVRTYRLGRNLRFKVDDLDNAMTVEQSRHLRVAR